MQDGKGPSAKFSGSRLKNLRRGETFQIPQVGPCEFLGHLNGGNRITLKFRSGEEQNVRVLKVAQAHQDSGELFAAYCQLMEEYRQLLKSCGIKTPEPIFTIKTTNDLGQHVFIEISPYIGPSCDNLLLKASPQEALILTQKILEATQLLLSSCSISTKRLLCGLDMIPRNFTQDSSGQIWYVDHWPPKKEKGDKLTLEYPEPNDPEVIEIGIYRNYTLQGILQVFLTHLCRLRPELRREFQNLITKFLQKIKAQTILQELDNSPAKRLERDDVGLKELLEPLGFPETLDLREIACELVYQGKLKPQTLDQIFQESHFQDQKLEEEKIQSIKHLML